MYGRGGNTLDVLTRDKIINTIIKRTDDFQWDNLNVFTAQFIAEELSVSRNLVSQYLNEYHREGKLIKINTRPVIYLDRETLSKNMNIVGLSSGYESIEDMKHDFLNLSQEKSSFAKLVGYKGSLKQCVKQCKAAITYPGLGLPILIQGQTGTGKSYMAQLTYDYGVEKGIIPQTGKFINVNCAEYANNPELFLTNLFGFKKGAYTGAEKDKSGLMNLADGGVLFFDEIHALKPECQEKIFLFMDKGIYHMVGDNETWYSAKVRLIFATTEEPQKVLLKTLLRRIPIVVQLPSLLERSVQEKRELIHDLVHQEEVKINKSVLVSELAYYTLLNHTYIGNVGELSNSLKASVANAFIRDADAPQVEIHMYDLPDFLIKSGIASTEIMGYDDNKMIYAEAMIKQEYFETMIYSFNEKLIDLINSCATWNELNKKSFELLEKYSDYLFYNNSNPKLNSADVTTNIVENIYQITAQKYNIEKLSNSEVLTIAKFIQDYASHGNSCFLLSKKYHTEIQNLITEIKSKFPINSKAISNVVRLIQDTLNVDLGSIGYLDLLIYMMYFNRDMEVTHIPVIIIAHGFNIASGIADVANQLLKRKIFDAIDMPIESGVDVIICKLSAYLKCLDSCEEILLMVDMGSLEEIYKYVDNIKNVNIGILNNVTTKLALDIGSMIMQGYELEKILKEAVRINQHRYLIVRNRKKANAILSICQSGFGTAEKIKKLLKNSLPKKSGIQIISYEYDSIEMMGNKSPVFDKYNIILMVGTTNPNITGIDYISLEELIEQKNIEKISQSLSNYLNFDEIVEFNENLLRNFSMENLLNYLTILNPEKILQNVEDIIKQIEDKLNMKIKSSTKVGLYLHISCLIERLIIDKTVVSYDKLDILERDHQDFIKVVKEAFESLEIMYNVKIPLSEIGYLFEYLNKDSVDTIENSVENEEDLFDN